MRPQTYDDKPPERRCSNCKHAKLIAYKLHLLCFHGDTIEVTGQSEYPVTADFVQLNGDEVGLLEGDDYDKVWSGRVVDGDAVCQEWEPE